MLTQVADGVLVHESACIQSNAVVVQGESGVLLIDPGITAAEMAGIAADLRERGLTVAAGFATHPDWDHALWHPDFGDAPRYGTDLCAATLDALLAQADWREQMAAGLPPEFAEDIPLEGFGRLTGLPAGTAQVPWDGPRVRIVEHRAHAPGHAALLVEGRGVLAAGDMLSDILPPFLDLEAADPVGDYLAALALLEDVADEVVRVVPGHGSVCGGDEMRARIALDRAYAASLRDGTEHDDPRIGPGGPLDWMTDVHGWQQEALAEKARGAR